MSTLHLVSTQTESDNLVQAHHIHQSVQIEPWSYATFEDCFTPPYYGVLAFEANKVVGFAIVLEVLSEATLMDIAVDESVRGKGVGKALLSFVLQRSHHNGMEEMWLDVRESNQVAISLYEKLGFHYIDTRKNYYPTRDGKENALVMKWSAVGVKGLPRGVIKN